MSENLMFGPSDQIPFTEADVKKMYPFGYFVFPDGEVYGRDPLQEANAGLDVDPAEIDKALRMIEDEREFEEYPWEEDPLL